MARFIRNISYGPILIVFAAVLWGMDGILRRSLGGLSPITIVFYEHLFGAILIAPFFLFAARKEHLNAREWTAITWVSLLSGVLGTLWFTTALNWTGFISFSVVFLLQKLQPLFAIGAAAIFLRERLNRTYVGWAVLALVAAYFVTFPEGVINLDTGRGTMLAALFAIGAALAWGSSTALLRYTLLAHSHTFITGLRFWLTVPLTFLAALLIGEHSLFAPLAAPDISSLFMIAVFSGFIGLWVYYRGLKYTQVKVATVMELAMPFTGVAIDALVYHTVLAPSQYFAAGILLFAMYRVAKLHLSSDTIHEAGVTTGKGRGRVLKFPTLNLHVPEILDAEYGIYAGWVAIGVRRYPAAIHYGSIPTFREREVTLEAHLIDTKLEERPERVYFELAKYLRPIQNFRTPEELKKAIAQDVARARQILLRPGAGQVRKPRRT